MRPSREMGKQPKLTVRYQGRDVLLKELADQAKVNPFTFRYRVTVLGWPVEEALNTPPLRGRQKRQEIISREARREEG